MSNWCGFSLKAVGRDEESVKRLLGIMEYKDAEFFIYRVQEVAMDGDIRDEGGFKTAVLNGYVAWDCTPWFYGESTGETSKTGAKYSNLREVCKSLGIGIEVWAREPEFGFEKHGLIDCKGDIVFADEREWDGSDNPDYGEFKSALEISGI